MSQTPISSIYRQDRYGALNSPGLKINMLGSDNSVRTHSYGQATPQSNLHPNTNSVRQPQTYQDMKSPTSHINPNLNFVSKDMGSPIRGDMGQSRNGYTGHSQPRRVPTNHLQESTDGRHVTSTDSRNPLMLSFGESSREPNFNRSGANPRFADSNTESRQLYSSPMNISNGRMLPNQNPNMQSSQNNQPENPMVYSSSRAQPYSTPQGPRTQTLPNRAVQNQGREELELLRSKNKAFMSVTKEKFPEFLSRIEKMSQTVHRNINHSFTNKLKDIWVSYINDQNSKNQGGKSVSSYLDDLKPIENASVEALNSQTDNLIKKIKLGQLEEVKKQLTNKNIEPELDMQSPLFNLESEFRFIREKHDQIQGQLDGVTQEEEKQHLDMRKRNYNAIQKHLESYKQEYQIKISNDPELAMSSLHDAKDFYISEIARMRAEMPRNSRKHEVTFTQLDKQADLESRINTLKSKIAAYQIVN